MVPLPLLSACYLSVVCYLSLITGAPHTFLQRAVSVGTTSTSSWPSTGHLWTTWCFLYFCQWPDRGRKGSWCPFGRVVAVTLNQVRSRCCLAQFPGESALFCTYTFTYGPDWSVAQVASLCGLRFSFFYHSRHSCRVLSLGYHSCVYLHHHQVIQACHRLFGTFLWTSRSSPRILLAGLA